MSTAPGAPSAGPLVIGTGSEPSGDTLARFRRAAAEGGRTVEVRSFRDRASFVAELPHLEVLWGHVRAGQVAQAARLRWVHAGSAGVDGYPLGELASAGIVLTNSRGLYDEAMAEHALALLLSMVRRIPEAVREHERARWQRYEVGVVRGTRVGILGFGSIGRAIAERVKPLGAEIWAVRARPRPDPLVSRMFGASRAEVLGFLGGCQNVVAVLPSTPATRGLIDAEALAAMPRGSRLVNLGRADLIVEEALDEALRSGHLAGAGLDTPPRDPLPPDSPLWSAPGALVTPHVGGWAPDNGERGMALFTGNLARYCRGEPLQNLVDFTVGY